MTTAMPDAAMLREIHARARAWAGMFRLPLRQRVWRGTAGDLMGRGTGCSLDFQDHRAYAPGDDPRHINWQAYARTGQYTMKLFREEVRPVVDVVFDGSPSMFFTDAKARRSLELFYFCVEGALRAGATPAVHLVTGESHRFLTPEQVHGHSWLPAPSVSAPAALPRLHGLPLRAQSLRLLVSDLLFPGQPDSVVAALAARSGRGVILAPFCQEESDPDWDGNVEFIDAEADTRHPWRIEPAILRRYQSAYARHFSLWKDAVTRLGIPMGRVPAELPFPAALQLEALRSGAVEPWA